MDWRALQDVVAVAETGSLSAAARRLNVSQPTVGRRIEQLEDQLDTLLFNRTTRGLLLTKVGEGILNHAKQMEEGALAIERIATGANQELQNPDSHAQWYPDKKSGNEIAFHVEQYPC